jgi:hypothetical protein
MLHIVLVLGMEGKQARVTVLINSVPYQRPPSKSDMGEAREAEVPWGCVEGFGYFRECLKGRSK